MFRRLQNMIMGNSSSRVDNGPFANCYGSMAARNFVRSEAQRDIDIAMYRIPMGM